VSDRLPAYKPVKFRSALRDEHGRFVKQRLEFNIEVDKLSMEAIFARLYRLDMRVRKLAVRRASRAAAYIFVEEMQRRAPVDTGRMRNAIKVRAVKRSRRIFGTNATISSRDLHAEQYDKKTKTWANKTGKPPFFYPASVEYGTRYRAATPFMRPAFEAVKDQAENVARAVLLQEIEKVR
jgi:HK97 gp10 family phage protein